MQHELNIKDQLRDSPESKDGKLELFTSNSPLRAVLHDEFPSPSFLPGDIIPTEVLAAFWYLAAERQNIFLRRLRGISPPYSQDPIFVNHKFTNAYRASDRVSQYLIRNVIYSGSYNLKNTFFRIILFKLFNKIETWQALEREYGDVTIEHFSYNRYDQFLSDLMRNGTIYSAAYMMPSGKSAFGHAKKHQNHLKLIESMLDSGLPDQIVNANTMGEAFELFKQYPTMGDFLAYQFVTDINYSELTDFSEMEFIVPGPGALDGIQKCFDSIGNRSGADLIRYLTEHQQQFFDHYKLSFEALGGRPLQLIDIQNVFCETEKYSRVRYPQRQGRSGRTRIKQKYRAGRSIEAPFYPPKWGINKLVAKQIEARL